VYQGVAVEQDEEGLLVRHHGHIISPSDGL